jgi:hypothetical protein
MSVFGTPGRLVSWAKRCPQTRQSGKKNTAGSPGKGDPWLNGPLGEIAASASRTDTFLGERYRRLAKRRGKRKAQAAIARSILVIIFHLLSDPAARYRDLGSGYYDERISAERKIRSHVRQLQAPGPHRHHRSRRERRLTRPAQETPARPSPSARPGSQNHAPKGYDFRSALSGQTPAPLERLQRAALAPPTGRRDRAAPDSCSLSRRRASRDTQAALCQPVAAALTSSLPAFTFP